MITCAAVRSNDAPDAGAGGAPCLPSPKARQREQWLDLGRVLGLFFIVLYHANGRSLEFPLFFQRVPFLFMAAAYFVGRRETFSWRHSPCRYVLFYLAWNGVALAEGFGRHLIYQKLGYADAWDWGMLPWKLTGLGVTFPYDGPLWFLKYVMTLSLLSPFLFALRKRRLLVPVTVVVAVAVVLFPRLGMLFAEPPRVPWADALAFFMMGFCLSRLTLGEIKSFLKKTAVVSIPALMAVAWLNFDGMISEETLHTLPFWLIGILGLGSLCVLLTEYSPFRRMARACSPLFFFIYAVHCLVLPYMVPALSRIVPQGILPALLAACLVFAGSFFFHRFIVRRHPSWEYLIFAQKGKRVESPIVRFGEYDLKKGKKR